MYPIANHAPANSPVEDPPDVLLAIQSPHEARHLVEPKRLQEDEADSQHAQSDQDVNTAQELLPVPEEEIRIDDKTKRKSGLQHAPQPMQMRDAVDARQNDRCQITRHWPQQRELLELAPVTQS